MIYKEGNPIKILSATRGEMTPKAEQLSIQERKEAPDTQVWQCAPESNQKSASKVELLSWNVAGWTRCISHTHDTPFFRSKYDIILLQETWSDKDIILDGFDSFMVKAIPGRGPGRLKGGG